MIGELQFFGLRMGPSLQFIFRFHARQESFGFCRRIKAIADGRKVCSELQAGLVWAKKFKMGMQAGTYACIYKPN